MKAIETRYNGHRFRSRTEARWSVFLDHLGVAYEYEPEGYELDDGTRYLPDFYLPREDTYVEIKGASPSKAEVDKAGLLAYASGKWVNLFIGQPGQHEVFAFRGNKPLPASLVAWLDECPDEHQRWRTAGALCHSYAVPNRLFDVPWISSSVPQYDTRYDVQGIKKAPKTMHLELDYAPELHRLMVWRVWLDNIPAKEFVDQRYGLSDTIDERRRCIRGVPWNASDEEWRDTRREYFYPDSFAPSTQFVSAIRAAKSARFEFGESGAG